MTVHYCDKNVTVKLFHELWLLEQHGAFDEVLKVRVDTSSDPSILCRPLTSCNVNVIAHL